MVDNRHYGKHRIQAIELAWEWDLTPEEFSCIKYIERAGDKPGNTYNNDILKAIWFLGAALFKDRHKAQKLQEFASGLLSSDIKPLELDPVD
jgi:hypothetical protein